MVFSVFELADMIIMTAAVGFIFMGFIRKPVQYYYDYNNIGKSSFDWESFKIACWVTAPALILHELAHKFAAMAYGFSATFHAAYTFLGLGIVLRILSSGIIFFVPAYVSIGCASPGCTILPIQSAIIAAAGPFTNLALFAGSAIALKTLKKPKKRTVVILQMTKTINLFLFIFNMLPLYFFDGYKVFSGIFSYFA